MAVTESKSAHRLAEVHNANVLSGLLHNGIGLLRGVVVIIRVGVTGPA
jgi:hypothetical protein